MSGLNRYKIKKFFTVKNIFLLILLIGAIVFNNSIKPKPSAIANQYKQPSKPINIVAAIKAAPVTIPAAIKSAQKNISDIAQSPEKARNFLGDKVKEGKQNFKDATSALQPKRR